jgi:hypothetical protein
MNAPASVPTLLADHSTATEKFLTAVKQLRTVVSNLDFPLGSPAKGYDLTDILATLNEWAIPPDPATLEWAARDCVNAHETFDLVGGN